MLKLKTIGMIEKNAKNNPVVVANEDMKNGSLYTVSEGRSVLPVDGTSGSPQSADLYVAINTGSGDARYTDFVISEGDYLNSYLLKAWEGQEIVFDESHITYGSNQDYSKIVPGVTKLVAGTDGKFKIASDVANYKMHFEVMEKLQFNGNAVSAKIVLK